MFGQMYSGSENCVPAPVSTEGILEGVTARGTEAIRRFLESYRAGLRETHSDFEEIIASDRRGAIDDRRAIVRADAIVVFECIGALACGSHESPALLRACAGGGGAAAPPAAPRLS